MKKNRVLATLLAAMVLGAGVSTAPILFHTEATTVSAATVSTKLTTPKVTAKSVSGGVKVSWGKVSGATKYHVYRKAAKNAKYAKLDTTSATSYTDKKAHPNKVYYYKVVAANGNNKSAGGSVQLTIPVATVKNVTASKVNLNGLTLKWDSVPGARAYEVYRSTSKNGPYKKVSKAYMLSYTEDGSLNAASTYYYKVRAKNSSFVGKFSDVKAVKTKGKYCSITYELDGAENNPLNRTKFVPGSINGRDGFYLEDPPERKGYIFLGWFDAPNTTEWEHRIGYFDPSEYTKDVTIYAAWSSTDHSDDAPGYSSNGWTVIKNTALGEKDQYYSNGYFNLLVRPDNLSGFVIEKNRIVSADDPDNHPYIKKEIFMMVDKETGNKYYAWDGCELGKAPPQGTMAFSEAYSKGHTFEPEYGYFLIPHTEIGESGIEYSVKTVTEEFAAARNRDGFYLGSVDYYKETGKFKKSPLLPEVSAADVFTPPSKDAVLMMAVNSTDPNSDGFEWIPFLDEHKIVVTYDRYADTGGYNNFIKLCWCVPSK